MTGAEQIRQEERERQEKLRQEERERMDRRYRDAHRDSLYAVLEAREIAVPEFVRTRMDRCDDIEQIVTWLRRAATAETAIALLDEAR